MVQLYKRKGGEILVNTATANNQSGGNIALLPGGGFVVVWSDGSMTGADTSSFAVRGQRFDAAGNPVGGEFLVNSTVTGNQSGPTVATLASGRFVVTWSDASATGGDTSGIAVRGQIFEADGTPVGAEFLINTATANNQSLPAIVELSGGGFVVTWADNSGVGGDTSGSAVKAQIFDAAGAPVGGEFLANTTTLGSQGSAGLNVIGLTGGGFAIAYSTTSVIGSEAHATIWVQQFNAAGTKVGGEAVVNGDTLGNIINVNITALNAGFIVTWAQQDSLQFPGIPVTYNVRAQMFDAAGAKLGAEFLVNTNVVDSQTNADVDRLPGGGFLITWQSPAEGTTDLNIYGQFFDDNGARIGGEFLVNTVTGGSQTAARIEVLASGDIAIIWTDGSATGADASGSGIKMQILTLSTDAPTDMALSDTSISETAIENLAVATLSATNAATINSHFTYTIVSDASGGAFRIEGDKLVVDDSSKLDFETQPSVEVRIRATDLNGTFYEETLTIAVGDVVTETRYAAGDAIAVTQGISGFNFPVATVALAGGGYALLSGRFEIGLGDDFEIRIYDSAGVQAGAAIVFDGGGAPFSDLVADALPDGGFVIAFVGGGTSVGNDFFRPIRVQRFDENGHIVGSEQFAHTSHESPDNPAIAVLNNGNFVVTWTLGFDIGAQMFDSAGVKIGGELIVNTVTDGQQAFSNVAALADGGFVVTWRDGTAIEGQIFNSAGAKVGGEHIIVAEGAESNDLVALDNGTFLVTWDEIVFEDEDVTLIAIRAQLVDAAGVNLGAPITILPVGGPYTHHVAAMPGGFVVSWSEPTPEQNDNPDYLDGWAQLYDLAGRPIGEAFQTSPETSNSDGPQIAAADNGDLLLTWGYQYYDANFSSSSNMLARLFTREALPPTGPTEGPDILNGTSGNDVIDALGGDDIVNGLAGNDILIGGAGTDILSGGEGSDTYFVDNAADLAIEGAGAGFDAVYTSVSYTLAAGTEVEWLSASAAYLTGAINLTGNGIANYLLGNEGANILNGGGGADVLVGYGGNDTYYVDHAGDVIIENPGGGFDAVYTNISYTLNAGAEVEWLAASVVYGTGALDLTGNEFSNYLLGNEGINVLNGAGGADVLVGYGGNDVYYVDNIGDVIIESGGGFDAVYTSTSLTLTVGAEIEWLTTDATYGTGAINLTGNDFGNYVLGNQGANVLDGGAGADVIAGYGGADTFAFTTALGGNNIDSIVDMAAGTDKIGLDDAIFTAAGGLGALNAAAFATGAGAADASDRIVYNSATGQLFYDADGLGGAAQVQFATLNAGLALTASDFVVI